MMPRIATMRIEIGIVEPERRGPGREQREQDRLGRVGDRREVVAREDRQGLDLRQALAGLLVVRERAPEGDGGARGDPADRRRSGSMRRRARDHDAGPA